MNAEPARRRLVFPQHPIPAKAGLRAPVVLPEYLPARMLNEFVYCPRLFFYEWVENVFRHSVDTEDGKAKHEKHDAKEQDLPPTGELGPDDELKVRSVTLSSDTHGLIAKLDLVEVDGEGVVPVDYKRGSPKDGESGPEGWPADVMQIVSQALVLRDNGYRCDEGLLFYYGTRQRVRVPIDEPAVAAAVGAMAEARGVAASGRIPPPLVDSPKCPRCSLVGICLPDETQAAMSLVAGEAEQGHLFEPLAPPDISIATVPDDGVRRLIPARDDLRPLYVTGYQLSIGKSGERLQIKERGKLVQEARLNEISQVNVFGPISLTGAAIQGACYAERPVAHFSVGGWFYGLTTGLGLKNVFLRRDQFRRADDESFCLAVASGIVATKIRNQRTLLQRNHIEPPAIVLDRLKRLAHQAMRAPDLQALLGIEGAAAAAYFGAFAGMLKVDEEADASVAAFDFRTRNRRPPRDPVNALLSFAYSLLTRDLTITCHAVGFDPFIGFYHQPRFGRPALALDLMEGFRPLVADSAVLSAVNTRMVTAGDFVRAGDAVALSQSGRTAFIRAYEQRMDQLVTHPIFGYRVSYRRVLEVQARLLARFVSGELPSYPGFETR